MEIRYGKQYSARMGVEELFAEYVQFNVVDSTLTVSMDERRVPMEVKRLFRGKDAATPAFRLTVTMPETLRSLQLDERAELVQADDLVVDPSGIELRVTDNARVSAFQLDTRRVSLNMDKRAGAALTVRCDSLYAQVAGNASLKVEHRSRVSEAEVAGAANLVVSGETQRLLLSAKGNSKSILNGSAPMVRYKLSGAANVNAVNLEAEVARAEQSGLTNLTQAAARDLYVDLSTGSTLVFLNDPAIHVLSVKNATILPYDRK
ncbi:MAG: DUF2807 domain-containing protein [Bacteroidales bacterium]|nr:DUF2807 domain-containing protein [Bacteroidales bacterium]